LREAYMSKEKGNQLEAQERFEAALRGALKTSPKPHAEMKWGKPRSKKSQDPPKREIKR